MVSTPNRLLEAIAQIERGEQVDWQKLADLQALDLAVAGRQFAEQAIVEQERLNEMALKSVGAI